MPVPTPEWFNKLNMRNDAERLERNRFLLKLAGLYFSPEGTIEALAEHLGGSIHVFRPAVKPGYAVLNPRLAVDIEKTLGATLFPRGLFRPDIFL